MYSQIRRLHSNGIHCSSLRSDAVNIFRSALKAVTPQEMVKNSLSLNKTTLIVNNEAEYLVYKNVYVVAFGKAVLGMARAVQDVLGPKNIIKGVASIPCGLQEAIKNSGNKEFIHNTLLTEDSPINVIEGAAHNLPDERAQYAANQIQKIAESVKEDDLLIVLISGGGSALLPSPVDQISMDDKLKTIKAVASSGGDIIELNTIRKNLSKLKGGRLAQFAYPAKVITLILSDIIGDPLDMIASGPTVLDTTSPQDCLDIIKRLHAESKVPANVMQYLTNYDKHFSSKKGKTNFSHVHNVLVGTNKIAVNAAAMQARSLGYSPIVASTELDGVSKDVGAAFANVASFALTGKAIDKNISQAGQELLNDNFINEVKNSQKPLCVIGAGETTVNIKGTGLGGRNQEMTLSCALKMHDSGLNSPSLDEKVVFLSAGTDGQDGPCSAAGALAGPGQVSEAIGDGLDPQASIDNNDSYNFYSALKGGRDHIITGLTGTNVMDIQVLLVDKPGN